MAQHNSIQKSEAKDENANNRIIGEIEKPLNNRCKTNRKDDLIEAWCPGSNETQTQQKALENLKPWENFLSKRVEMFEDIAAKKAQVFAFFSLGHIPIQFSHAFRFMT